jgi:hypothetical protein
VFLAPVPVHLLKADYGNAAVGVVLAIVGIGGFGFVTRNRREQAALLTWLVEHSHEVASGSATYHGYPLRLDTKLRTFQTSVSLLLVSFKFSSQFVPEDAPGAARVKWASTLASLLLGWWGIPFGPIFTVSAVYRNARGGNVVTVGDLLAVSRARLPDMGMDVEQKAAKGSKKKLFVVLGAILAVPASLFAITLVIGNNCCVLSQWPPGGCLDNSRRECCRHARARRHGFEEDRVRPASTVGAIRSRRNH